jgi:hypothetical protein
VLLIGFLITSAAAQDPPRTAGEYQIKAVCLYNFLLFVQWPDGFDGPFTDPTICILGQDPFAGAFAGIEDQPRGPTGSRVRLKRLGRLKQTTDLSGCHIIFISSSEQNRLAEILSKLEGAPSLTVADVEGFLEVGGMIQLVIKDESIGWRINLTPVEEAGLEIDTQLLDLAVDVGRFPHGEEGAVSSQRTTGKGGQPR